MSCHGCALSFGFLNREKGCPKCGFAYCKKCLRYKLPSGTLVCKNCNDKAMSTSGSGKNNMENSKMRNSLDDDNSPLSFTETVQVVKAIRRLESLEDPSKPPIVVYADTAKPRIDLLKKGMSFEDQKLVDRLANLRNSEKSKRRKSEDPAEDIASRLAHLRGEDPGHSSSTSNMDPLIMSKNANETEEELLARLAKEASLDKKYSDNLVSDLEERLGKLREPTRKIPTASCSAAAPATDQSQAKAADTNMDVDQKAGEDDDDEETEEKEEKEVQRIINKFVAEVALDPGVGSELVDTSEDNVSHELSSDDDDLNDDNMCRICDARATLRCKECDGDIFCVKCFKEFHHELGEVHKPTPFKK